MNRIVLVAEIGISHNGYINIAKQMIDIASMYKCDFVKFQKRTVSTVYSKKELDMYRESPFGNTNRDLKEQLEFGREEYDIIDKYCKEKNIGWYVSPWDIESYYFLKKYNPPYIKIASAMLTDLDLLHIMKDDDYPIILSTGMSKKHELDKALDIIGHNVEYILACTSSYPTKDEEMNLNFIKTLKEEYPKYKIGFSNHHPSIMFMICAQVLGAQMLEFHITLDRAMYGSDQAASIGPAGVERISRYSRGLEVAMGTGEWTVFPSEEEVRKKLRKC